MQTHARIRFISYATGGLQGLAFSLLPALATLFTTASYHINSSMYGMLFIPQTVLAVIGAFTAPALARRFHPITPLRLGIGANLVALCALAFSSTNPAATYACLLLDTAALGLGFGLCNSSANAMVELASTNSGRAITILNTLTGLGTSLSPAIFAGLHAFPLHVPHLAYWQPWPLALALFFVCIFCTTFGLAHDPGTKGVVKAQTTPKILWIFALATIFYGTCEGSFSTWATAFGAEHHADTGAAEIALTGFWLTLTAVRIIATLLPKFVPLRTSIAPLSIVIAIVLFYLPFVHGNVPIVAGFLVGGAACGVIYPYLIANALHAIPHLDERVTGYMTGSLMIGEGVGSFGVGALRSGVGLDTAYRGVAGIAVALAIISMLALRQSPASTVKSSA